MLTYQASLLLGLCKDLHLKMSLLGHHEGQQEPHGVVWIIQTADPDRTMLEEYVWPSGGPEEYLDISSFYV